MSIATNLKREMIRHDLTPAQLSERTGVSKTNINKYLDGRYKPAQEVLERLAEGLCISVDELTRTRAREVPDDKIIKVADAARMMGIPEQTLRICLQRGIFTFGIAVKPTDRRYTYKIFRKEFMEFLEKRMGGTICEQTETPVVPVEV